MSAETPTPATGDDANTVYHALENYPWDSDVEFQSGLAAILGNNSSPEQQLELTLRARCFYYSRKYNVTIDFDGYKAYRNAHPTGASYAPTSTQEYATFSVGEQSESASTAAASNPSEPAAPYPSSFAHIVELISTGQSIPGIREIPDTVLTGQGSQPTKSKRRKPWEKEEPEPVAPSGDGS